MTRSTRSGGRRLRPVLLTGTLVVLTGLSWPAAGPPAPEVGEATPFRWNADELFRALESEFNRSAGVPADTADAQIRAMESEGEEILSTLPSTPEPPLEPLRRIERIQFEMAVRAAAHPEFLPRVQRFLTRTRVAVMAAALGWPRDRATHEALYRVVFGGRMALDEAMVQAGPELLPPLLNVEDVPSAAPYIEVEGVRVHSGDLLLSRGGAPTSALIARGNDFPNPFSHAAMVHVDGETGEAVVVEALIELGSVVTPAEEFLAEKRYRLQLLRVSPDLPEVLADPLLPHRAAEAMLARVRAGHVPYDFAMAWDEPGAMFCSEVVFHGYEEEGLDLWAFRSSMTSPGLVSWLASMGVREFTTLVPSDLEYDPRVRTVVEWRSEADLVDYRLDNAVTDALLEAADRGARLGYPWYMLPAARALKGFSVLQSTVGAVPLIPEGMNAPTALRVESLVEHVAPALKEAVESRSAAFREERGFEAPYWELVAMAREALEERQESLGPWLVLPTDESIR